MKKVLILDDNGPDPETLGRLLRAHGFSATVIDDVRDVNETLWQSERRYRDIFENAPIGVFRSTPDGKFLSVNPAVARMLKYESPEDMLRMVNRTNIAEAIYLDPSHRREVLERVLLNDGWQIFDERFRCKDGSIITCKFHLRATRGDGGCVELDGFVEDVSARKRSEDVMSARMRLLQFSAGHTLDELLEATLNEAEDLTDSRIGFYHFLESDQKTLRLQNWSTGTKAIFCRAHGKGLHYDVSQAGVWVDCIRQRRPVVHNNYATLCHRRGLPPGHAPVTRELVVPVFRGESIVAVLGVGNKPNDYTGEDVEVVSLLADLAWGIAERKQAEDALRISEREYRDIVEHAPFGILRSTGEGKLISTNPALAGILKYDSPEELLETVNRSGIRETLFAQPSLRDALVEQIRTADSWHVFENRYRCRDESVITCKVYSRRILGREGKESEFESFLENITERLEAEKALRESEEKFRVLAETAPAAIIVSQGERFVYANPAAARLFGCSEAELLGRSFRESASEESRELVGVRWLTRQQGEQVPSQYEHRFENKRGEKGWAMVSTGTIEYRGKPACIATIIDITASKRVEEQLQGSLAEKEVLLKEVHHRVKNNLQMISSLLDLQSDYIRDEQSLAFFRDSRDRIKTMALVHEMLYNSKDFTSVDFNGYVESLTAHLSLSHIEDSDRVSLKLDISDLSLDIEDAIPCGLIINELISNSLKHAFPGGRRGEIAVACHAGNGGLVTLEVRDNGVGLPAGLDFRNTETLGLQIVNLLTKQLRGTVELRIDRGVSFTVHFRRERKGSSCRGPGGGFN